MTSDLRELESRIEVLEKRLDAIEGRSRSKATDEDAGSIVELNEGVFSSVATHLGRVLLIFGGAYFLRAITDYQFVPTGLGIAMGGSYALLWLFMAYRAGADQDRHAMSLFFAIASNLLALPLLAEAVTRFELLSGAQGALALAVYCALSLGVAMARDHRILAFVTVIGGTGVALYLPGASQTAVPFVLLLLGLGLASLWVVYRTGWKGPQWLGALGAHVGVVALVLLSSSDKWSVEPSWGFNMAMLLMLSYLASFILRSHRFGRDMGAFEVVQGMLVLGLMVHAAVNASAAEQLSLPLLGSLAMVMGAGVYGLAFTPQTLAARGKNFFFYSTLGLAVVAAGSAMLVSAAYAAPVWSLLAVLLAWFSGRRAMVTLSLQCTLLLLAAGIASGVLGSTYFALAGDATAHWPPPAPWEAVVGLATVACLFIRVAQRSPRWGRLAGFPQMTVLVLAVWEIGGLMVAYLAPLIAGVPGEEASLSTLAALRTTVLAGASVSLAYSSRFRRWPEARWLAYPVLALVGAKLLVEDFPNGTPVSLFVALGVVGGAMMIVSRLLSGRETNGSAQAVDGVVGVD